MSTRRQHRRLDKIEEQTDSDPGPLLVCVGPSLEPDPPHSFQTTEACEDYFEDREGDPTVVVFSPVPEDKEK